MGTAREGSAVAVFDGKLYAVGGFSGDDGDLSSVERNLAAAVILSS